MKLCVALFLAAFLRLGGKCATPPGKTIASELRASYRSHDYFALASRLPELSTDDPERPFFEGVLAAATLRDERAEERLGRLLALPGAEPSRRVEALLTLGNSRLRRGSYAAAVRVFAEALRGPTGSLGTAGKVDAEQNLAVARALSDVPPPSRISGAEKSTLPVTRDRFGLIHFNLQINGEAARGVLDTLSNGNLVSESFARSHRLRMLETSVEIRSITGRSVPGRFAVAEEVRIGGMIVRNAVFLVLREGSLAAPGAGESADVVAGLPLILPMGRVRYDAIGSTLAIGSAVQPPETTTTPGWNLAFDGLTPLVRVKYQEEFLPFVLDTGAARTKLLPAFGARFPDVLAGAGTGELRGRGVGGVDGVPAKIMPSLSLEVGSVAMRLQNVPALTAERAFLPPVAGTLGADFLRNGFELDLRAGRFTMALPP